jgi:cytochrome c oxidase assembly protein subunit 15
MSESQNNAPRLTTVVDRPALRILSKGLCLTTLVLIFMGGLVKSHEAGLSVPDWPTTYGQNMFLYPPSQWQGGIFYEHTHRLVASFAGLLTLVLCAWLALVDRRAWLKVCGAVALAVVVLQGILGGLTVRYLLPAPISVAHGVLAQSFLLLAVFIAYSLSKQRFSRLSEANDAQVPRVARWATALTMIIWLQLVLGAVMRHTESGLAIPDFPSTGGQWIPLFDASMLQWINEWRLSHSVETGADLPAVTMAQVVMHFAHRVWAIAALVGAFGLVRAALRARKVNPAAARSAFGIVALLAIQIALGVLTVWTAKGPWTTSFHVVTGAALLALTATCAMQAMPVRLRKGAHPVRQSEGSLTNPTPVEVRGL